MIKKTLLLVAIVATSFAFPASIWAQEFRIEVGDRPYYSHGPRYWDNDWEMTWVPGHWSEHHHWIHGHYVRGQHRHHNHDRYDDHHNDHHDDHEH